jgi:hypothetical protein
MRAANFAAAAFTTVFVFASAQAAAPKLPATFAEEAFCERPIAWNAKTGKFDFAPVSAIKMVQ